MTEPIIDSLSEQAVKFASLVWKKEPAEVREIIWQSIKAHEIDQDLPLSKFQEYVQGKARPKFFTHCPVCGAETPPSFTHCPSCNVNLEIVRNNAITELALAAAKYGFITGQQSAQTPPRPKLQRHSPIITIIGSTTVGCVIIFFILLAYGFFNDIVLRPLLYSSPTQHITPTLRPKNTSVPTIPPKATEDCLLWSKVTTQMEGQIVCVYGEVFSFYPTETSSTHIRFSNQYYSFFIQDVLHKYPKLRVGDCISITGKVRLYGNIPYMEAYDNLYYCQ